MRDSKKYFHAETIKRISRLELRAKYVVEGVLSGMHRSPFFGQSIEFRQHRDYVQGDDLRHVDWKVWARQDRLYIKQFEEDTDLHCHLLVDVSQSMSYGEGVFSKYDYAATLACSLAYLVIRQKDCVGCSLFDSELGETVPCLGRSTQLEAIASLFNQPRAESKTEMKSVLKTFSGKLNKKGLVIIISDFFDEPENLLQGMRLLRQQGHDLLIIHVLDRDELEFPFDGPTHFEGLESSDELKCNPSALRETYLEMVREYQHELKKSCDSARADYECCSTNTAFNTVLSRLLNRRMARQKR